MAESIKKTDQQYKITETISSTAQTAWQETKKGAKMIDEKLHVQETASNCKRIELTFVYFHQLHSVQCRK